MVKEIRNNELCLKLTYKKVNLIIHFDFLSDKSFYYFIKYLKLIKQNKIKNIRIDIEVLYEIFIFDGKISEESIKYILTENRFKNKLLKTIFSFSPDMLESKDFLKNFKNPNKNKALNNLMSEGSNKAYSQKCYFFIFEENSQHNNDYDYLIISLDSNKNSNETLMQDIARKLNDYQEEYKLSCVFSDEKKIYLILETSETEDCSLFLNSLNESNA